MEYDIGQGEQLSSAVIRAVSAVEGLEPASLPPLTDVLDTEALDTLFAIGNAEDQRIGARFEFFYSNSRVIIDDGECLTILPVESAWRPPIRTEADTNREGRAEADEHLSDRKTQPGSRVCIVCQQPIDPHELRREHGELIHAECRPEVQCGVSFRDPPE